MNTDKEIKMKVIVLLLVAVALFSACSAATIDGFFNENNSDDQSDVMGEKSKSYDDKWEDKSNNIEDRLNLKNTEYDNDEYETASFSPFPFPSSSISPILMYAKKNCGFEFCKRKKLQKFQ